MESHCQNGFQLISFKWTLSIFCYFCSVCVRVLEREREWGSYISDITNLISSQIHIARHSRHLAEMTFKLPIWAHSLTVNDGCNFYIMKKAWLETHWSLLLLEKQYNANSSFPWSKGRFCFDHFLGEFKNVKETIRLFVTINWWSISLNLKLENYLRLV